MAYNNWEYYLSERGAFGRVNDAYELDVHLGYPIQVGNNRQLHLLIDVFDLLDTQTETRRSIRYTTGTEVYQPIDWFTGETTVIQPGSTTSPPLNSAFNTANQWTSPRSIRLGVRFSF